MSYKPETAYRMDDVIGTSRPMQQVFAQVHLVAPTRSTVVLRGESGTGKEVIARAIHTLSARSDGPYIKVNCAALPDTLLESELFGHEKGAFTGATQQRKGRFELAHGGTLFLDEIGDISSSFQAKLLRVLQEREFERIGGTATIRVDVRIVCATNRNLEEAVAKGDFRADLYYRINVVPIFIPALRERRQDIPELAAHFLKAFNRENERKLRFSDQAMRVITSCNYPGNVRELENCVYRVATMTRGELIDDINLPCQNSVCHCASLYTKAPFPVGDDPESAASSTLETTPDWDKVDGLEDLDALPQRERLIRVMERSGWVQAKAARLLGMTPRQIGYALRKHNVEIKRL
jgi:Nif-specific regulatory protein